MTQATQVHKATRAQPVPEETRVPEEILAQLVRMEKQVPLVQLGPEAIPATRVHKEPRVPREKPGPLDKLVPEAIQATLAPLVKLGLKVMLDIADSKVKLATLAPLVQLGQKASRVLRETRVRPDFKALPAKREHEVLRVTEAQPEILAILVSLAEPAEPVKLGKLVQLAILATQVLMVCKDVPV